ncbi:MAG: hypothetical protein ABI972_14800 [Acidobacteriota bacterium]
MKRTFIVAGIAGLYLLFVFGKRWWNARELASRPTPSAAIHPAYAGNELKVLNFLASPGVIRRGQKTLLCYGVLNAKSVRIEPHVDDLKPSLSRCLEVRPQHTTEYKLEASGKGGKVVRASLVIEVR